MVSKQEYLDDLTKVWTETTNKISCGGMLREIAFIEYEQIIKYIYDKYIDNRVEPLNVEIPPDTKKILDDIFDHVNEQAKKEYEESDLYKTYEKFKEQPETLTRILLRRWNKDMLITVHHVEKNCGRKFELKDLIVLLERGIQAVKQDYENFLKRYSA